MSRPQKERKVKEPPKILGMKPIGVPAKLLDQIIITIDEYEAIRLADYEGMAHQEAADKMEISRPTFTRLIEKARKKIAESIIDVKDLIIEGGSFSFNRILIRCWDCGALTVLETNIRVDNCPKCSSKNYFQLNDWFRQNKGCGRGQHFKNCNIWTGKDIIQ